ncbi:hypothetical protein ACHAPU_002605 [Fusarium lateritium]
MSSETPKPLIVVKSARYRTASHELRRLPLTKSEEPLPAPVGINETWIVEQVIRILKDHKLSEKYSDITLDMMGTLNLPDTFFPTILIVRPWIREEEQDWVKAVETIANFMFEKLPQAGGTVRVEAISANLFGPVCCDPVKDEQLLRSWDNIRALVGLRLSFFTCTRDTWTCIALFRYGVVNDDNSTIVNEHPATIYISVDYDSEEDEWLEVVDDIQQKMAESVTRCSRFTLNTTLAGKIHLTEFLPMVVRTLLTTGSPKSICESKALTDKLWPPETHWEKYILTNYPICRPAVGIQVLRGFSAL